MDNKSFMMFRLRTNDGQSANRNSEILAWGVRFPSGMCYVDWNRARFPEHQRYDNPHISMYGSLSDCQQAIDGVLETIYAEPNP